MAEEEKREAETGLGGLGSVWRSKWYWGIIITFAIFGTLGKRFFPGALQSFGPQVISTFSILLWAYVSVMMAFLISHRSAEKSYGAMFLEVMPIFILGIAIPGFLGLDAGEIAAPLILLIFTPFISRFLRGGIMALGAPAGERIETWRREWLGMEEKPPEALVEGNIAAVRDAAQVLVQETS